MEGHTLSRSGTASRPREGLVRLLCLMCAVGAAPVSSGTQSEEAPTTKPNATVDGAADRIKLSLRFQSDAPEERREPPADPLLSFVTGAEPL